MYHLPFEKECWLSEVFDQDVINDIPMTIKFEVEVEYMTNYDSGIEVDHLELNPDSIEIHIDGLGILQDKSWSVTQNQKIVEFVNRYINNLNLNDVVAKLPHGESSKDYDDKEMWE